MKTNSLPHRDILEQIHSLLDLSDDVPLDSLPRLIADRLNRSSTPAEPAKPVSPLQEARGISFYPFGAYHGAIHVIARAMAAVAGNNVLWITENASYPLLRDAGKSLVISAKVANARSSFYEPGYTAIDTVVLDRVLYRHCEQLTPEAARLATQGRHVVILGGYLPHEPWPWPATNEEDV